MISAVITKETTEMTIEGTVTDIVNDSLNFLIHIYRNIAEEDPAMGYAFKDLMQEFLRKDDIWDGKKTDAEEPNT